LSWFNLLCEVPLNDRVDRSASNRESSESTTVTPFTLRMPHSGERRDASRGIILKYPTSLKQRCLKAKNGYLLAGGYSAFDMDAWVSGHSS
jgi:hypothetical protein